MSDHPGPDADPGGAPDPDDLAGYDPLLRRVVRRTGLVLGVLVSIGLVLPAGSWVVDELRFRRSGDAVVAALGDDDVLADALVLVRTTRCDGGVATGSGFLLDLAAGPVLVTNRHVVDQARSVGVRPLTGSLAWTVEAVAVSDRADVAVLTLGPEVSLPAPLAPGAPARIGQQVRTVGFPAGQPATDTGQVAAAAVGRLLVAAPTRPGASGSPVLDTDGRVVGQLHARTPTGDGVATPILALREAIATARPAPPC